MDGSQQLSNPKKITRLVKKAYTDKNVFLLYKIFYDDHQTRKPTPTQQQIIKKLLFNTHQKIIINAYTRYGKTFTVARASLMKLFFEPGTRTAFIGPKMPLLKEFKKEVTRGIIRSPLLRSIVQTTGKMNEEKFKRKSTSNRQTFSNGSEYIFLSASKKEDLMSYGADTVISEEDTHISREAQSRVGRLLGDNPEGYQWVKLFNPESKNTHSYDCYKSEDWHVVHVPYQVGIREGRTTQEYVDTQKKMLTGVEFTIQYLSEFPEQTEYGLYSEDTLQRQQSDTTVIAKHTLLVGVDVASHGNDHTVITMYDYNEDTGEVLPVEIYSEEDTELSELRERFSSILLFMSNRANKIIVSVDKVGVGEGFFSDVKQLTYQYENVEVRGVLANKEAFDKVRFKNLKAELYFKAKDLLKQGNLFLHDHPLLLRDMRRMEFEKHRSSGRLRVIDPDKSPDYADSTVYSLMPLLEETQRDAEISLI